MLIRIAELARGRRDYEFELAAALLADAIGERDDVLGDGLHAHVWIEAELVDRTITLSGISRVMGRVVCGRCGDETQLSIELPWRLILIPKRERGGEKVEDIELGYYSGDRIDVSREAIEQTGLYFPDILLCRPDCRGLCPNCRANLNRETCRCPK
ncbi:DUF177 domain-containing protein [bacterium]|nr:DUF177 domain-containing protein [bacterium]